LLLLVVNKDVHWSAIVTMRICITVYIDTIPACDGQTYFLPQHSPRYAYASRGKNWSR